MSARRPRLLVAGIVVIAIALLTGCFVSNPTQTTAPTTTAATGGATRQPTATVPAGTPFAPDRQQLPLSFIKLPGMVDPPGSQRGVERYLAQSLNWTSCGAIQCATVVAPMMWEAPDMQGITLQLYRRPATATKIGTLFVNPGGPGGGGRGLVESRRRWAGLEGYDIVGWDPRGSERSTPVRCFANQDQPLPELDALNELDASPDNEAEYQALVNGWKDFDARCAQNSGVWLRYITTYQVVQDMDLLRQLVGDAKLTYLGYSYGTYLGSVYANYFPDKVGRLVLDAAVNITDDESLSQAQGFDRALGLFAEWEGRQGVLGSSKDAVLANLTAWMERLDANPIPVGARKLTQSLASQGIVTTLYGSEDEWSYLEQALDAAMNQNNGRLLLSFADSINDRNADGTYGQMAFSFPAMLCSDASDHGLKWSREQWADEQKSAPFFGKYFGPGVTCEQWAVQPMPPVRYSAPTAPPILVVGGTGDPATPYEYAGWMADQLGSGVLLTYEGPGHGTFGGNSSCIDRYVVSYLVQGQVPQKGVRCS